MEDTSETADFGQFHLEPPLREAIDKLGFVRCTPIQDKILGHTLKGKDAVGKAQTGTGKTAAFLISIINQLVAKGQKSDARAAPPVVIVAPVRELATQIFGDTKSLLAGTSLRAVCIIGGENYDVQLRELQKGPVDIVIGTPGRLLDFMQQKKLNFRKTKFLVIDEADRLLDMGFIRDVSRIIGAMPSKENRQTMLFSATIDTRVKRLANAWLNRPVTVEIEPEKIAAQTVEQKVYLVSHGEKRALLKNFLRDPKASSVIVFVNRRHTAQKVFDALRKDGARAGMLSGAVRQEKRSRTLKQFREGKLQVLVATDVAGRGLHIDGVSHVLNYDLPEYPEDYVHRIGRTGRAGLAGESISLACEDGVFHLEAIEKLINSKLPCTVPPEELLR